MADRFTVQHDKRGGRFFVRLQGYEACLMYRLKGKDVDLYHTYVPVAFRGRGMAERLCKAAFEYAKAHGLSVTPSCSYICDVYLRRHPGYEPLAKRHGPTSTPLVSG